MTRRSGTQREPKTVSISGWMRLALAATLVTAGTAALGATPQGAWPNGARQRPGFDAGLQALERQDWRGAVRAFERIVGQRTWDDDAYTLLAFSYRKLGEHRRALRHYGRALELNPYHLDALEYLGEAYLELGDATNARATLTRLGRACQQLAGRSGFDGSQPNCPEWRELAMAIEAHTAGRRPANDPAATGNRW